MSNAHHQTIIRGMRRALAHAGVPLTWQGPAGEVAFSAIRNEIDPPADGVQLNTGANTPCTLDCLASDFPGGVLPSQDDAFAGDGLHYRVSRREWVRGNPVVRFHCPAVVPVAA